MRRAVLCAVALLACVAAAHAAGEGDWRTCTQARGDAETRISACTRLLDDKAVTGADRARAHLNRGAAQFSRARYAEAKSDFDRAIALEPRSADHHVWRGRAHLALRRWDDAIKDNNEAIRLQPRLADAFNNRGFARAGKGEHDAAIADYDRALELAPQHLLAMTNKGRALELSGRIGDAVAHYERVVSAQPRPGEEEDQRARQLAAQSLKELRAKATSSAADMKACEEGGEPALAACGRIGADATRSAEQRAAALYRRSGLLFDRRQYEAAIADLDQSLQLRPGQALAYNRRGLARHELNRHSDAIADFDKALAADPGLVLAYNNRGNAHRNRGDYDKALADYAEALKRAPGYLHPLRNRGYAYERMGLFVEAERTYRQVLAAAGRGSNPDDQRAKREAAIDLKRIAAILQSRSRLASPIATRAALLIANTSYQGSLEPLATPANDVRALAAALQRLGFSEADVTVRQDLDRRAMIAALREFEAKARTVDWAFVFFAGHGVRARNNLDYMIPIDARIESERDLADEAVALERVVERIGDARRLQLVVFDACRSNELTRRLYATAEPSRATTPNVAPFEAPGLMLAFSARRGQSAFDGRTHSPFVEALLANLDRSGVDLEAVFAGTADAVRRATKEQQIPEIFGLAYGKGLVLKPN